MKQHNGWFITGTDTGVGKTSFARLLLQWLTTQGYQVCGFKPIASGAIWRHGQWVSEDAISLQQASSITLPLDQLNPFCFSPPIAPHIAAEQAGVELNVSTILASYRKAMPAEQDYAVVEGAGGLMVPLNTDETLLDLIHALSLPVIIVVGIKLGCINHALLTYRTLQQQHIPVAGWVANKIDPQMLALSENLATLTQHMGSPLTIMTHPHAPLTISTGFIS